MPTIGNSASVDLSYIQASYDVGSSQKKSILKSHRDRESQQQRNS